MEYDGVMLGAGPLDGEGLTPVSAVPAILNAMAGGYMELIWREEDMIAARLYAGEESRCTVWLDGETLRVQYMKTGIRTNWNLNKELTITLPEGTELENAEFQLTSGSLVIPDIRAEKLKLNATSGELNVTGEVKRTEVNTTSGIQNLVIRGTAEEIRQSATSGMIRTEAEHAKQIRCVCTSGDVTVRAERNEETSVSGTSATVSVRLGEMKKLEVTTTSGNVSVTVPEKPGFRAELGSLSGSVDIGTAMTKSGDQYVCGDGSGRVEIRSASGSIRVETAE